MPDYDFSSLSPIDFETLSRDLIQAELNVRFESFTSGRDGGIDFRYSKTQEGGIVLQCKHYAQSGYKALAGHLKKSELEKVRRLKPSRYLLATSVGLTPKNKELLLDMFAPFIVDASDIYGRDDLNNLLGIYPQIERHTPKLWLSSIAAFEEILHSKVKNVSRDALERIRDRSKLYVQNDSFAEAMRILEQEKVCIIAGIPGIGKSTLAEMLILSLVRAGYEVVNIESDISEATALSGETQKRVYYYDDFLGQVSLGEKLNKNEEQSLLNFIDSVRRSKTDRFILTTREYILNQARMIYEKVDRSWRDVETYVLDLAKYTRAVRAKILFNHLYFSGLPRTHIEALRRERTYLKIVDHENYNPRLIEFMTDCQRIRDVSADEYGQLFLSHLDNPAALWKHAFEEQLSEPSRSVLIVLATLPDSAELEDIRQAFESFHRAKRQEFGFPGNPRDFERAIRELDGNFVHLTKLPWNKIRVSFHNPSIRDYVRNHISGSTCELQLVIRSAVHFEQLVILWNYQDKTAAGEAFAKALTQESSLFAEKMLSLIGAGGAATKRLRQFKRHNERAWEMTYEERVDFIVWVRGAARDDARLTVASLLPIVHRRLTDLLAHEDEVVTIFRTARRSGLGVTTEEEVLAKAVKESLWEDRSSLDAIGVLLDLSELHPGIVTSGDVDELLEEFLSEAASAGDDENDPAKIREIASTISSLGDRFGVSMQTRVDELEDWAAECESATREDDRSESWPEVSEQDSLSSDREIDSMFSTL